MDRSFLQFSIYAVATLAIAFWRILPCLLGLAAFFLLLGFVEHGTDLLHHISSK